MGNALLNIESHDTGSLIQLGDWISLAQHLGLRTKPLRLVNFALGQWGLDMLEHLRVDLLHSDGSFRVLLVTGQCDNGLARSAMTTLHRRNPNDVTLWLWADTERLSVAMVSERENEKTFVRRMSLMRSRPDPVGIKQLEALFPRDWVAPDQADQGLAIRRYLESVLDQETLTREFFQAFRRALELLQSTMHHGPEDLRQAHDVALLTLLRVLFLYFLQARGALRSDPHFLIRAWRQRSRDTSFYRSVIQPLFFSALNTPEDERDPKSTLLQGIPFLNGGLFDPSPVELAHSRIDWPDRTFELLLEEVFERYQFALSEGAEDDEDRVIDPEMLGKVFEGLMFQDARHRSGAYYTPRHVVREMVAEVFAAHLKDRAGLSESRVHEILSGATLSLDERDLIRDALEDLTILDPAVGTGAFLLECLRVLAGLWAQVEGSKPDHTRLREIIHRHLHGVDINPTATRLCELRLWIALLGATPKSETGAMPPLPNLGHRIVCGQSLIDPEELGMYRANLSRLFGHNWRYSENSEKLKTLQDRYLTCHGSKKFELRRELESYHREVFTDLLAHRVSQLEEEIEGLNKLKNSRDLFGDPQGLSPATEQHLFALVNEAERLRAWSREVHAQNTGSPTFSYALNFPHVAQNGGFDIIVTNPPWVRAQAIRTEELEHYKRRFEVTRPATWSEADRRGISSSFGSQVDLAAIFLERSLELMKPGGRLAALIPAKIFRSLNGCATRRVLSRYHIERIVDYSDSPDELFDATTYPGIVQIADVAATGTRVSVVGPDGTQDWRQDLAMNGEPWLLVQPGVESIFNKMMDVGPGFLEPCRGIFTGANSVFIRSEEDFLLMLGDEAKPFLRRVLSGRDPRGESSLRILWCYDEHGEVLKEIPPEIEGYFEANRTTLEERSDYDPRLPLWQVFRVRPDTCAPKIVWRDIAPELEAIEVPARAVPLNTVYYLPTQSEEEATELQRFLNSLPVKAFARAVAERARGGYRRHFAWVVKLIPVPKDGYGLNALEMQRLKAWFEREVAPWR